MGSLFAQGHACIIGVGADLPNTIYDAQGIADILQDPERCAYPPEQVQLLTEPQATRNDILSALDQLAAKATADSTVIVYFSGHGYQFKSSIGSFYYLMPYDYDKTQLPTTAISGAEFTARLQAIPAQKILVLIDCCHAGGLSDLENPGIEVAKSPLPPEAQALFSRGQGRVIVASSKEDEISLAGKGKSYSAFTAALVEGLCGKGVAKQDGYVRVNDLALYTREVVSRRTRDRQHPVMNNQQSDNFVVAYYAAGEPQPKGLPFDGEPEVDFSPLENQTTRIVHAFGDRAVAIGGNTKKTTIITGDGNTL